MVFGLVVWLVTPLLSIESEIKRWIGNFFFYGNWKKVDIDNIWFEQDKATYHATNAAIELLQEKFEN